LKIDTTIEQLNKKKKSNFENEMNRGQGWKTRRGQGSRIEKNNNIFAIVPIPMPTIQLLQHPYV
jgi:hypothetical protein